MTQWEIITDIANRQKIGLFIELQQHYVRKSYAR